MELSLKKGYWPWSLDLTIFLTEDMTHTQLKKQEERSPLLPRTDD